MTCVAAWYLAQISARVFDSDCRESRLDVQTHFSMSALRCWMSPHQKQKTRGWLDEKWQQWDPLSCDCNCINSHMVQMLGSRSCAAYLKATWSDSTPWINVDNFGIKAPTVNTPADQLNIQLNKWNNNAKSAIRHPLQPHENIWVLSSYLWFYWRILERLKISGFFCTVE